MIDATLSMADGSIESTISCILYHFFSLNSKNQLFERNEEYWTESLRLSICSGIRENHLVSLEARIMPGMSSADMYDSIMRMDRRVKFSQKGKLPFLCMEKGDRITWTILSGYCTARWNWGLWSRTMTVYG